ncbi:MAG: hypothetical protein WC313_04850 [Candidatus Kapaibacterium sp.]
MLKQKYFIITLLVLNFMVLLGQILPESAPPFALVVNIITLTMNILFIAGSLIEGRKNKRD